MYTDNRDDEAKLIKSLICGDQVTFHACKQGVLEPFHKKAKKSHTDYVCKACGERYQVIKMLDAINR